MSHSTMFVVTFGRYSWRCSCGVEDTAASVAKALAAAAAHREAVSLDRESVPQSI